MPDEIIIKLYERSLFPGEEKAYDAEIAEILKDGFSVVTDNVYVIKGDDPSRFEKNKFIEYAEPNYIMQAL